MSLSIKANLFLPNPLTSEEWGVGRRTVAAAMDDESAAWLFRPNAHGLSPFRFTYIARRKVIVIAALGEEASVRLAAAAPGIADALSDLLGGKVGYRIGGGECSVTTATSMQSYVIPRLVWQRGNSAEEWQSVRDGKKELSKIVEEVIAQGLHRQADAFGFPHDGEGSFLRVVAKPLPPVYVRPGKTGRMLASAKVWFATNYSILGEWAVGRLCARGYGQIRRLSRVPEELLNAKVA